MAPAPQDPELGAFVEVPVVDVVGLGPLDRRTTARGYTQPWSRMARARRSLAVGYRFWWTAPSGVTIPSRPVSVRMAVTSASHMNRSAAARVMARPPASSQVRAQTSSGVRPRGDQLAPAPGGRAVTRVCGRQHLECGVQHLETLGRGAWQRSVGGFLASVGTESASGTAERLVIDFDLPLVHRSAGTSIANRSASTRIWPARSSSRSW